MGGGEAVNKCDGETTKECPLRWHPYVADWCTGANCAWFIEENNACAIWVLGVFCRERMIRVTVPTENAHPQAPEAPE